MGRMIRWAAVVAILALAAALLFTTTESAGATASQCHKTRVGNNIELQWDDAGGNHLLRRNGLWFATPGEGSSMWVDPDGLLRWAYTVRTREGGKVTDVQCIAAGPKPGPEQCQAKVVGQNVELSWVDQGGTHLIRRNGLWIATPGEKASIWVDVDAPAGATYVLRTRESGTKTDQICTPNGDTAPPPTPAPTPTPALTPTPSPTTGPDIDGTTERVLHVSLDGLRSDHVTAALTPRLAALFAEGASTLNARTDYSSTKTLPNHTSQFTGRAIFTEAGHRIHFNSDRGGTIHQRADGYVASVFDVVHDHGMATAFFAGKAKFDLHNRSWNFWNGANDATGVDNGRDKIDLYETDKPSDLVDVALETMATGLQSDFTFFHVKLPDTAGHKHSWSGAEYDEAVGETDALFGLLLDGIRGNPTLATTTTIIVTADHGGPNSGLLHDNARVRSNYTVPFAVWGPGVAPGADLYELNRKVRKDPGTTRPGMSAKRQPIRTHEVANLALDLLGLPPVPGSVFNADQSLQVS